MSARHIFLLALLGAIWGGSFVLIRLAAPDMGVVPMTATRVMMAALFMLGFILWRDGGRLLMRQGRHVFILGLLNTAIPFCMMSYATVALNVNTASILNATVPVWGMIISVIWVKNKPDALRILGVFTALCGVAILVSGKPDFTFGTALIPTLSALGATFLYAFSAHYTRRFLPDADPMTLTAGSLISAAVALLPLGLWFWPDHAVAAASWFYVACLAMVATVFAYFIYFKILKEAGADRVVLVTYLIPVFAMLWAALFLQEHLTLQMALGGSVSIIGTALAAGLWRPSFTK
jgi:drug/metabolite transporter (DMT)-like permease